MTTTQDVVARTPYRCAVGLMIKLMKFLSSFASIIPRTEKTSKYGPEKITFPAQERRYRASTPPGGDATDWLGLLVCVHHDIRP
jgi:hypothetical protein